MTCRRGWNYVLKWFVVWLVLIVCAIVVAPSVFADHGLDLSPEERTFLKAKGTITYCVDPNWMPYEGIDDNGNHQGMSSGYIKALSDMMGIPFVLNRTQTWRETLQKLHARECDLVPLARETKERKTFLDFSDIYLSFPYVVATTSDKVYFENLETHLDKTFAIVEGYAVGQYLMERYPGIKLLPVRNFDEGIKKLRKGEAFGYLDSLVTIGYYITEKGLLDIQVAGETHFNSEVSIATRNDEPELHRIIQRALRAIPKEQKDKIQRTWVAMRFANRDHDRLNEIRFNAQETDFIARHTDITFCVDPDWLPYEAIEQGKHIGIGADLFALIAKRSGLDFRLFETRSWGDSLDAFRAGKCDLLSMLNLTSERRAFMDYTSPYFRGHVVFVARNDQPFIADLKDIAGKRIVLAKGYSVVEYLRRDLKDAEIIEVENYDQAFRMVEAGEADLTADYLISSADRIQRNGMVGLKIAGNTPYKNDLRIGIQKDQPVLTSILNKTVESLEKHEVNAIVNKWRTVRLEQSIDYGKMWMVGGFVFLAFALTLYWNRRLSAAQSKTQKALDELQVVKQEMERLATTDKLVGLYNRMKLDECLAQELQRAQRFNQTFGVVILDVDFFKQVNDTYGHQVGDNVLIELAGVLSLNTRTTDIVGRWGGEEFVILCPQTDLKGTAIIADKLRQIIERYPFPTIGHLTASFGVSAYQDGDSAEKIVGRADRALYQAKEKGRNLVDCAPFMNF